MRTKNKIKCSGARFGFGLVIFLLMIAVVSVLFVDIWIFVAASIVCTGGITLIVYVPVIYIIGLIAEKKFSFGFGPCLSGNKGSKKDEIEKIPLVQKDLVTYILQAQEIMPRKTIVEGLKGKGWQDKDITRAFSFIHNNK